MNDLETFKIGYTAGLNVCFKVTNKFSVEAGLQYSNKGYSFKMQELVYGDMIDPRYGFIYLTNGPTGPTKLKFVYNYHYFDIPIRAILCFGNKKLKLITSAGITTNLLVNATTTSISTYEDGNIVRKTSDQAYNYKTLNLSPSISAGIIYSINDKIHLQAEPTLRYGILKIIDSPVTAYLWNSGLNISIYYAVK